MKIKHDSNNMGSSSLKSFYIRYNKYIATWKLEVGKTFAYSLFQHLDLLVSQIEDSNGLRQCKFVSDVERTVYG